MAINLPGVSLEGSESGWMRFAWDQIATRRLSATLCVRVLTNESSINASGRLMNGLWETSGKLY